MNGDTLIFVVIFIIALALTAGVVSSSLVHSVARLSHLQVRRHGHRH